MKKPLQIISPTEGRELNPIKQDKNMLKPSENMAEQHSMKETEEQTQERLYLKIVQNNDRSTFYEFAKLYHAERLKIEVPRSEKINQEAIAYGDFYREQFCEYAKEDFENGAKWAIKQITGV